MISNSLSTEENLLIELLKPIKKRKELNYLNSIVSQVQNWEKFTEDSIRLRVAPLLYSSISECAGIEIPKKVVAILEKYYYKNLGRNVLIYDTFKQIAEILNKEKIKAVALKGIVLAEHIYKNIALRQLSDIDLLVPVENINKCAELLFNQGFRQNNAFKSDFIRENNYYKHLPMLSKRCWN